MTKQICLNELVGPIEVCLCLRRHYVNYVKINLFKRPLADDAQLFISMPIL